MSISRLRPLQRASGFSLMELLITVVIIGIVVSIGYPSYMEHTKKTRRTEATGALLNVAGAQEKFFMQDNQYTAELDADGLALNLGAGDTTQNGYYSISIDLPEDGGFVATATLENPDSDPKCKTFTLDHTGLRGATNQGGAAATDCWR